MPRAEGPPKSIDQAEVVHHELSRTPLRDAELEHPLAVDRPPDATVRTVGLGPTLVSSRAPLPVRRGVLGDDGFDLRLDPGKGPLAPPDEGIHGDRPGYGPGTQSHRHAGKGNE